MALGRTRQPSLCLLSIGAGFDFIAGLQRRAPPLARRFALEWLWPMLLSSPRLARRHVNCALILPNLLQQPLAQRSVWSSLTRSADLTTFSRSETAGNKAGLPSAQHVDDVSFTHLDKRTSANNQATGSPSRFIGAV